MKKGLLYFALLAFGFGLTACSSDDDSPSNDQLIIGKWVLSQTGAVINGQELLADYTDFDCATSKDYVEFKAGGEFRDVYYDEDCITDVEVGLYSIQGDNLTVYYDEDDFNTVKIESLSSSTLKVSRMEGSVKMISVLKKL